MEWITNWFWIIPSKAGLQMELGCLNASTDQENVTATRCKHVLFHCTTTMLQFKCSSSAASWAPGSHLGLDNRSEHVTLSLLLPQRYCNIVNFESYDITNMNASKAGWHLEVTRCCECYSAPLQQVLTTTRLKAALKDERETNCWQQWETEHSTSHHR